MRISEIILWYFRDFAIGPLNKGLPLYNVLNVKIEVRLYYCNNALRNLESNSKTPTVVLQLQKCIIST